MYANNQFWIKMSSVYALRDFLFETFEDGCVFIETSHVANNVCIQQSIVYEQKVRQNSNLEGSKCIL